VWSNGTPQSFVDLAPVGTTASEVFGTDGTQQVGDVSVQASLGGELPLDHHPGVWRGTASSFQMLPLPQGDNGGIAYGIDGGGNIVGTVGVENNGALAGATPIVWVPHRLIGDANFDGTVNFSDLLVLAQNYGKSGEWVDGDFNGDGTVGFDDLLALAQHYGESQPAIEYSMSAIVPEPSALVLSLLASLVVPLRSKGVLMRTRSS